MPECICKKCTVAGRVQGVFFRASTAEVADRLGLTGHALNLPDGTVEVLACGQPEAVNALCEWLRDGPRQANVTHLHCEDVQCDIPARFTTG